MGGTVRGFVVGGEVVPVGKPALVTVGGMVLLDTAVCLTLGIMGFGLVVEVMELVVRAAATVLVTCMIGGGVRGEVTCKETRLT